MSADLAGYIELRNQAHLSYRARWSGELVRGTQIRRRLPCLYRWQDRGSQALITVLREADPVDHRWLVAYYRMTNRPEPWLGWLAEHHDAPTRGQLEAGRIEAWLRDWHGPVFGSAYPTTPGREGAGIDRITLADRVARDVAVGLWAPKRIGPIMRTIMQDDLSYVGGLPRYVEGLGRVVRLLNSVAPQEVPAFGPDAERTLVGYRKWVASRSTQYNPRPAAPVAYVTPEYK